MSYPTDPIRRWRRRRAVVACVGAALVAACAWWAADVPTSALPDPGSGRSAADEAGEVRPEAPARAPIDRSAFELALWNAPAPPPKPVAEPVARREEPFRLELLGIVRDGDTLRAALYDPEDDSIHLVASGETLLRFKVVRLAEGEIELRDGERSRVLRLREDPS